LVVADHLATAVAVGQVLGVAVDLLAVVAQRPVAGLA